MIDDPLVIEPILTHLAGPRARGPGAPAADPALRGHRRLIRRVRPAGVTLATAAAALQVCGVKERAGRVGATVRHEQERGDSWVALFHASSAQFVGIHSALVEGLGNGTLQPVIQQVLFAQASRAHEAVMGNGHHGKIVLVP